MKIDITKFSFDTWTESEGERWEFANGKGIRESLVQMTREAIKKAKDCKKLDTQTLGVIRYITLFVFFFS